MPGIQDRLDVLRHTQYMHDYDGLDPAQLRKHLVEVRMVKEGVARRMAGLEYMEKQIEKALMRSWHE